MTVDWKFTKDANDVLDYQIDWSSVLEVGETIATSTWEVETGITKNSDAKTTTTTTIWVSGGTAGESYYAYNTIVTSSNRTYRRFLQFLIREVNA